MSAQASIQSNASEALALRSAWARIGEITPRRFQLLLEHYGSESQIAAHKVTQWAEDQRLNLKPEQLADLQTQIDKLDPAKELAQQAKRGVWALTPSDSDYPELLRQISDAPFILFGMGDRNLLAQRQLGIVGTRKATRAGGRMCQQLVQGLVKAGFVISSGLAAGIDGIAHRCALDNCGKTIAVLGNGIDKVYPAEHVELYKLIHKQGCIISEYPMGMSGSAWSYPRRNRIISGLSLGIVVIEAGEKSGALITARTALDQDREVFAVPGSPLEAQSIGCNRLIQGGAKLVQNVDDILAELGWEPAPRSSTLAQSPSATGPDPRQDDTISQAARDIWLLLTEPLSVEQLVLKTTLLTTTLLMELSSLELAGYVNRLDGGRYARA